MTFMGRFLWLLAAAATIMPVSSGHLGADVSATTDIASQPDRSGTAGAAAGRQLLLFKGFVKTAGRAGADATHARGVAIGSAVPGSKEISQGLGPSSIGGSLGNGIGGSGTSQLRLPVPQGSTRPTGISLLEIPPTPGAAQPPLIQTPKAPGPQPATPGQPKPPAVPSPAGAAPAVIPKQQQVARVLKYWDDFSAGMQRFIVTKVEQYSDDVAKAAVKKGTKKAFETGSDCGECIAICARQQGHMEPQWCWNILQTGSIKDAFKCPCKLYYGKPKANPSAAPQLITPKDLGTL